MLILQRQEFFSEIAPLIVGGLAVTLVFGVGKHILYMSIQALRRKILNQHVLLEAGAFAGLGGGLIGLIFRPPGFPTTPFFAVAVMVVTYHIFSEWLSLIVKTRSSQAVKRLLDLQPETAWVARRVLFFRRTGGFATSSLCGLKRPGHGISMCIGYLRAPFHRSWSRRGRRERYPHAHRRSLSGIGPGHSHCF